MNNSFYDSYASVISSRASGYRLGNNSFENCEYQSPTIAYSAGALLSTVEDLFKWHRALMESKLISKELFQKALTAKNLADGSSTQYGYGWFINPLQVQGSPTIMHSGGIKGFSTIEMYLPNEDIFVTVLSNLKNDSKVQEVAIDAATLVMGRDVQDEQTVKKDVLEKIKGKYQMNDRPSRYALIKELNGKLIIEVLNEWKAELSPISQFIFTIKNIRPSATVEFVKGGTGQITKFVVDQKGLTEWTKIE